MVAPPGAVWGADSESIWKATDRRLAAARLGAGASDGQPSRGRRRALSCGFVRLVVQRVKRAQVSVDGEVVGRIGPGMLVLAGVEAGDGGEQMSAGALKLARLRFFEDERGRMNLDVRQAGGAVLLVSQFTLAASTRKGRRPSFDRAAAPSVAEPLLEQLRARLEALGVPVEGGRFGARMEVELVNDGPVTFVLDVRP